MSALSKLLVLTSITCYLWLSSMALVHAFPSLASLTETSSEASIASTNQQKACHQGADVMSSSQPTEHHNNQQAMPDSCEIACAISSSIIETDNDNFLANFFTQPHLAFLPPYSTSNQTSLEPHPPR